MSQKKGLRIRLEEFISSDRGQRFFNFAYCIGAAVVICGALFKIIHLPGADILLTVGMGTEVIMFMLNAFDRPTINYNSQSFTDAAPIITHSLNEEAIAPIGKDKLVAETEGVITEMARLRETTSALNTLYELQLKSMSANINAIDSGNRDAQLMREILSKSAEESRRYCDETVKMADNLKKLNAIYDRMISAMSSGTYSSNQQ